MLARNILDSVEIGIISDCVSAIIGRDKKLLSQICRVDPRNDDGFWFLVNLYGHQKFSMPSNDEIGNTELIPFSDGRGYAIDIYVKTVGNSEYNIPGMYIAFEIITNVIPSRIGVSGIEW